MYGGTVMYRIYTIIALVIVSLVQFSCYSNIKNQRNEIKAKTTAKFEKQIAEEKALQDKAFADLQEKVREVESDLEAERNNIKIEFRDIRHETQKVITERIYTECKLDDAGLSIANKAVNATNSRITSN